MGIMVDAAPAQAPQRIDLNSEATWNELYTELRLLARNLVYTFRVSLWHGQEGDMVEDIVQETVWRIIERARKAERGEASPIYSLKHMTVVIAQNYCRDLWRRDRKLFHVPEQDGVVGELAGVQEQKHELEAVVERMYQEWLLVTVAYKIAGFPKKQREALLIDLANYMSFDEHLTPLQKAFLEVGIQLEQYKVPLPADKRERGRYLSLRTLAYKRLAHLNIQSYDLIE